MNFKLCFFLLPVLIFGCDPPQTTEDDFLGYTRNRRDNLKLSVFITAQAVDGLLSTPAGRREAISILRANGITKVYLEVYRSGLIVPVDRLQLVSEFFVHKGFEVAGAIATVPGENFGLRQEARYSWLNFQNPKTQKDLKSVMEAVAPIFDTFIIDDFLCTADTSTESKLARGDRDWPTYRRDLLVELSQSIFIEPAKRLNPDIRMIIKYPQWYDRFHLFGYDVARQPDLFDEVWIGTETRNMNTQRFGFVQPYEGFINYRWLASLSGTKRGGSWFDHIECTDRDFIDQAYQSVLAGSKELTLFNYFNFTRGHPGHHLMRLEFDFLADLAMEIAQSPVYGVSGYKPPNSDAGGDMYVMDFIGMLGIPLVPVSEYPVEASVVFLPTQAAADPDIDSKIEQTLENGGRIIVTAGFLGRASAGQTLSSLAGISLPRSDSPILADSVWVAEKAVPNSPGLDLESRLEIVQGQSLLAACVKGETIPFLFGSSIANVFVLNSHTFSQEDFDAVGEVLLCPKPLGLMEIPREWANTLRAVFNQPLGFRLDAPARVSFQPFGDQVMIQNYNDQNVTAQLHLRSTGPYQEVFTGKTIDREGGTLLIDLPGRSRVWIRPL